MLGHMVLYRLMQEDTTFLPVSHAVGQRISMLITQVVSYNVVHGTVFPVGCAPLHLENVQMGTLPGQWNTL